MSLREIFCQDRAIGILQKALASDRLAHAYIFAGLEGVGRSKVAAEWSKLLLCKKPVTEGGFADSCASCESCKLFEAGSHPDFHSVYKELREFTRDGKGKPPPVDLPKDVIREFLIEKVSARPSLSQRRIFVVTEAEKLNASSQNTLLKVLEEPPGYCSIILLCTRLEKLLPTTKSRCQIIRFGPVDTDRIIEKLKEASLAQKQAQYFGRLSQGSLGEALLWAQLELGGAELYETKVRLIKCLASCRYSDCLELAGKLLDESKKTAVVWNKLQADTSKVDINRRAQKILVRIIISGLHDAMKVNIAGAQEIINFDQQEQIKQLATRFDAEQAAEKIADAYETMRWIDSNVNEKLIFEQLLLNLVVSDRMGAGI